MVEGIGHDMIILRHVRCREKVEIGVTCAPTKSYRNISGCDLKTTVTLDWLLHLQKCPMLLNNACHSNQLRPHYSILPPFQLKLLKIGVQCDKVN